LTARSEARPAASSPQTSSRSAARRFSLNSRATRGVIYQIVVLAIVVGIVGWLAHNTQINMAARGIPSGFDFLSSPAGFDIGETVIPFDPSESYGRAIFIGVLNTLKVALIGIVLTTILGVLIGVGRFSANALVRGLCYGYIELFRNVPVLLQLFMWYLLMVEVLPPSNASWNFMELIFLSKGGLSVPAPAAGVGWSWVAWGLLAGLVGSWLWRRRVQARFEATGQDGDRLWTPLALAFGGALLGWLLAGRPSEWELPEQLVFMVDGGMAATPEFLTVLIGLVTYTAAFVAEVVRGGIQSVGRGQTEAASALGLSPRHQMRLVVMPQALRVIIPPLTNQYLNLTKNSSLAVAVGYPDVVSVANTTINQSGRAVECIAIIMLVYLSTSLSTSALMNWYNKRVAIKER
jgi:general L-amino acid transport system permease protein